MILPHKADQEWGDVRQMMEWWNSTYPIDRWWREKHGISFGSTEHKAMSMIDMRLEFEEDFIYKKLRIKEEVYVGGEGNWINPQKIGAMTKDEEKALFDRLDISKIEVGSDGRKKVVI